jgi:hypothetical protein
MSAPRRHGVWAAVATLAVAAGIVGALVHLGSPAERRLRRLDEERLRRLDLLRNSIETFYARDDRLPPDFAALRDQPWLRPVENDPETGAAFGYEITGPKGFRLCADFARRSPPPPRGTEPDFWTHPQGRHCFDVEVAESLVEPKEPVARE